MSYFYAQLAVSFPPETRAPVRVGPTNEKNMQKNNSMQQKTTTQNVKKRKQQNTKKTATQTKKTT